MAEYQGGTFIDNSIGLRFSFTVPQNLGRNKQRKRSTKNGDNLIESIDSNANN